MSNVYTGGGAQSLPPDAYKEASEKLVQMLVSRNSENIKQAESIMTEDIVRKTVYENSIVRQMIPFRTEYEIFKSLVHDQIQILYEIEPKSPGALSIGYNAGSPAHYFAGKRGLATPRRIRSHRMRKDVAELRTYEYDIQALISNQQLNYIDREEDRTWLRLVEDTVIGVGSANASGYYNHQQINGVMNRAGFVQAREVLQESSEGFKVQSCLMNDLTYNQLLLWGFEETGGGSSSAEILTGGMTRKELFGTEVITTIKRQFVRYNRLYWNIPPENYARCYEIQAPVMHIDTHETELSWHYMEEVAGCIVHTNGVAITDYVAS